MLYNSTNNSVTMATETNSAYETFLDTGVNSQVDAFDVNDSYTVVTYTDGSITANTSAYYDENFLDNLDYSSIDYPAAIKSIPVWEMVVKVTVYVLIMAIAIVGNVLIIAVVIKNRQMQTTTNFYIVNLAVSDLLVTVFCTWVQLVDNLTEGWVLGTFFCKFNSFAQVLSLVSSIFSLTLIACDRFFGIVFAMKAHIIERKASHSIVILWLCSIAMAAPLLHVRTVQSVQWRDHTESWCDDQWPSRQSDEATAGSAIIASRRAYYTILTVILYFLPMILMFAIYLVIILTVWFARSPGERVSKEVRVQGRVKRKVILMLVLILATFGLCWLPLQVKILYSEYRSNHTVQLEDWYYPLEFFAYTIAFANSALNPVIYAGFNENFRKGFRALFGCYERKLYAAISRIDSMYSSTTVTKL